MPTSRRRVKTKRRSRLAAGALVILVLGVIGYVAVGRRPAAPVRPTLCMAGTKRDQLELTVPQAGIAAVIAGVASTRAMPPRAVAIAYAAALQESDLANLPYGDLDSLGVFQQRPSQGWGTPRQIENPAYASGRFFAALARVPGYLHMPIYQAAQAVQRSADGSAYDDWAVDGTVLAQAFSGAAPHGVWCSYSASPTKPRLAAASEALTSVFGPLLRHAAGAKKVGVQASSAAQGWTIAAWLMSHAASYGINEISYRGYQWRASTGPLHWVRRDPSHSRASSSTVVFG